MPAIVNFPDWLEATGPFYLTDANRLVNDAALEDYLWPDFARGQDGTATVQGGDKIVDDIMLDEQNTFGHYQPNQALSPTMPQILVNHETNWRFAWDSWSYTDEEIDLNKNSDREVKYKDIQSKGERRVQTSICNGVEGAMCNLPNFEEMESATGLLPHSIHSLVTEQTSGLPNSQTTGVGTAYTTVMGISPTAAGRLKWRNRILGYDSTAVKPTSGARNIINALDDAYVCLNIRPPKNKEQYFEGMSWNKKRIYTEKKGVLILMDLMRQGQDWYTNRERPDAAFPGPMYGGLEIRYWAALNAFAGYKNATTGGVTSGDTNAAGRGPRLYVLDTEYLKMVWHSEKYFTPTKVMTPFNQPWSHTVYYNAYYNMLARSRMRHAIITPGTVAGVFGVGTGEVLTPTQVYAAY